MVTQTRPIASKRLNKELGNSFTIERKVLTFSQGCEYTGLSESYMYKLTSAKKIPHSKPNGKKIFFDKDKLDEWLLSNSTQTVEENEAAAATYVSTH